MPVASNDEFSTNSCTLPRFVPAVFVNRFSRFVFISPILQHDAISARHHLARFVHRKHMSVGINYLVLQIEVVYKNALHARVDDVCNTNTGKFCVPGCNELESLWSFRAYRSWPTDGASEQHTARTLCFALQLRTVILDWTLMNRRDKKISVLLIKSQQLFSAHSLKIRVFYGLLECGHQGNVLSMFHVPQQCSPMQSFAGNYHALIRKETSIHQKGNSPSQQP